MGLLYGTDGIKQRDYRVWLIYPTSGSDGIGLEGSSIRTFINDIQDNISTFVYGDAFYALSVLIAGGLPEPLTAYSEKFGECRKDGITLTVEDGDSVEGNEVGNLILNKNCKFSAELINATPENINQLSNSVESKIQFFIVLEEVVGRKKIWETGQEAPNDTVLSSDTHKIIFVGVNNSCIASIAENIIGSAIPTVTLSVADSVANASDFRVILDVPYDLNNY